MTSIKSLEAPIRLYCCTSGSDCLCVSCLGNISLEMDCLTGLLGTLVSMVSNGGGQWLTIYIGLFDWRTGSALPLGGAR